MAAVGGRGDAVVGGIYMRGGGPAGLGSRCRIGGAAGKRGLGPAQADRLAGDTAGGEAGPRYPAAGVALDDRPDGGDGVVALAPGEFGKGPAGIGRQGRKDGTGRQFVGGAGGGQMHPEELLCRYPAVAAWPFQFDPAVTQQKDKGHLGRGIGMAEAADHRAPVPDRNMGDMRLRCADQRVDGMGAIVALQRAVSHGGTDGNTLGCHRDSVEIRNPGYVDQARRRGEAEVHRGNKALTASKDHRSRILGKQIDGLRDAGGPVVFEKRWLHPVLPVGPLPG